MMTSRVQVAKRMLKDERSVDQELPDSQLQRFARHISDRVISQGANGVKYVFGPLVLGHHMLLAPRIRLLSPLSQSTIAILGLKRILTAQQPR